MSPVDLLRLVEATSQENCREMGQLLIEMAESPRDDNWRANIALAISQLTSPEDRDIAAAINAGRGRVKALSDGLRADGLDHRTLIEAELQRRGDSRSFEEYRRAVGEVHSDALLD